MSGTTSWRIDALQYSNWSEKVFRQMRQGKVDAVHVTIAYHENFRATVSEISQWNLRFANHADLIMHGRHASDIDLAKATNRTAIFFGFQSPSPIEDDIHLVEIMHSLGVKFMQLTYNNQSLLATGCYEEKDSGLTRMGKEVIREMNRVGLIIDMSHSADTSTLEAIEYSSRPIAITHANPAFWHPAKRNKPNAVLQALAQSGGMLGLSLYPHHLKDGSSCSLESFCTMVCSLVERIGCDHIGLGTDLCLDQPNSVLHWMRNGRWSKTKDYGEGSVSNPGFPPMPTWFCDSRDFNNIENGLRKAGMSKEEIEKIMGRNWYNFFANNFIPMNQKISHDSTQAPIVT